MSLANTPKERERYVVKIGGSVLTSAEDYSYQAQRIIDFSCRDNLERAYIVLSAKKGHTDELVDSLCNSKKEKEVLRRLLKSGDYEENHDFEKFNSHYIASYLLNGEFESTQMFEKELRKKSIFSEMIIQGFNFPIIANGNYLHASIDFESSYKTDVLTNLERKIVLVPGFGAQNNFGEKVLLGRNASDYVAALIGVLDTRVTEVIYLKDVDGVYENFGKTGEILIKNITSQELLQRGCGDVLDERCLNLLKGYQMRIQHCNSKIGVGGTIVSG